MLTEMCGSLRCAGYWHVPLLWLWLWLWRQRHWLLLLLWLWLWLCLMLWQQQYLLLLWKRGSRCCLQHKTAHHATASCWMQIEHVEPWGATNK
jgi:hypothetical protein